MTNKIYDIAKWTITVGIPAIAALYFGLSQIWGFPYTEQIVGSLAVIGVFGGAVLGISSINYQRNN